MNTTEYYSINEEGRNKYIFFTKKKIEYQMVVNPSKIEFLDSDGKVQYIPDLALNCDVNVVDKDYKTSKTIAFFCTELSKKNEGLLMQIHNQPEELENNKTHRRGLLRIKLWSRLIQRYFKNYIMLTNQVLDPHKNSDIFCIVVKKNSPYFNQIVTNFYRFCYTKMYLKSN